MNIWEISFLVFAVVSMSAAIIIPLKYGKVSSKLDTVRNKSSTF